MLLSGSSFTSYPYMNNMWQSALGASTVASSSSLSAPSHCIQGGAARALPPSHSFSLPTLAAGFRWRARYYHKNHADASSITHHHHREDSNHYHHSYGIIPALIASAVSAVTAITAESLASVPAMAASKEPVAGVAISSPAHLISTSAQASAFPMDPQSSSPIPCISATNLYSPSAFEDCSAKLFLTSNKEFKAWLLNPKCADKWLALISIVLQCKFH
jgi:hypothetical protein